MSHSHAWLCGCTACFALLKKIYFGSFKTLHKYNSACLIFTVLVVLYVNTWIHFKCYTVFYYSISMLKEARLFIILLNDHPLVQVWNVLYNRYLRSQTAMSTASTIPATVKLLSNLFALIWQTSHFFTSSFTCGAIDFANLIPWTWISQF